MKGEERTAVGLYVPRWVVEKESVQGGRVIATGPGTPFPDFKEIDDEPWRPLRREARHVPPQTRVGDYAIFLRKAVVELWQAEEMNHQQPTTSHISLIFFMIFFNPLPNFFG